MRQIDRYVLGQLLGPMGFFALIFTGVIWLTQSLRIVDTVVNNNQSATVFLELSALLLPGVMMLVVPIAALSATLFTINRLYSESELTVLMAAGQSRVSLLRPAVFLGVIAAVLTTVLTIYLAPRAATELSDRTTELRAEFANSLLREGRFNHPIPGVTVYLRQANAEGEMLGIFIHDARSGSQSVTYTATQAQLVKSDGRLQMVMFDGAAQQFEDAGNALSILDFDRLAYDLGPLVAEDVTRTRKPAEYGIGELLNPPDALWNGDVDVRNRLVAEGHDKLSSPLYALAFPMLALAAIVGGSFRRGGVGIRVAVAVGIAVLVRSIGIATQSAVQDNITLWPALYVVPILVMLGSYVYLARRNRPQRNRQVAG
ncbi:lipopolysaccharide export system permease protein [Monaibacterium marinum]|uniref:Lipopolysaccharide export system permease protein n=1 Tax=Pontivivens marinum TaxID=1690039 RepID=A0A2C9CQQ0_9RHOB|nr:LPS export ABC transporter permease LptF [Monaibacterium marinum]SOH93664.1 lipopolysaccharide export system permease protein [Monaibacterium marinum]